MASQKKKDRREQTLQRSLVVQGGEIGTVTYGHFQSYTNFSMEIVHAVSSPKDVRPTLFGYVYAVKTSSGLHRDCFVSTDDNQTVRSFVRAASKSHPHLQWAKIADKLWSLYMLNMSKEYQRNPNRLQKTLVSRVGKQPNSNTWVLSPDVQVDHHGQLIPKRHQKFYWNEEYIHCLTKARVVPISISTPLSREPLIDLLKVTKKCLDNNFISSFLTVAGAAVLLHYESILGIQDECPLMLCFSPKSGTGKSSSLRNALSLMGAEQVHITGPDTHPAAIVSWAAGTTIPLGIDDVRSEKKAETVAVQFFNGFAHNTCSAGELKPHTSVIITSNSAFSNSERNSQRILHVPFFPPSKPVTPSDLRRQEMLLKEARGRASASIGEMISLGHQLLTPQVQTYMERTVLPLVIDKLPNLHFRVQKCYALLLTAAKLLCRILPEDIIGYNDVLSFFKDTWSPVVVELHSQGGVTLTAFIKNLTAILKPLAVHEVLQMVRPSVQHKKEASIALYMVSVREHCSLSPEMEKELKDTIKSVGGSINQSGLFLSTTSTATTVTKQSGVNRRSVAFIPRDQIGIDLLEALDAACSGQNSIEDLPACSSQTSVSDSTTELSYMSSFGNEWGSFEPISI